MEQETAIIIFRLLVGAIILGLSILVSIIGYGVESKLAAFISILLFGALIGSWVTTGGIPTFFWCVFVGSLSGFASLTNFFREIKRSMSGFGRILLILMIGSLILVFIL